MCGDSELTADKDELLSVSSGVPHISHSQVLCLRLYLQIKKNTPLSTLWRLVCLGKSCRDTHVLWRPLTMFRVFQALLSTVSQIQTTSFCVYAHTSMCDYGCLCMHPHPHFHIPQGSAPLSETKWLTEVEERELCTSPQCQGSKVTFSTPSPWGPNQGRLRLTIKAFELHWLD